MFTRRYFGVPKKHRSKKPVTEPDTEPLYKPISTILKDSKEDGDEEGIVDVLMSQHKNPIADLSRENSIDSLLSRQNSIDSLLSRQNSIDNSRRSNLSDLSLHSSNKSNEFLIPKNSNSIYILLKKINNLALKVDKKIKLKYKLKDIIEIDKIMIIKQYITKYLNDLIAPITLDIKSQYVNDLITNIRLRDKTPEYKKEYKIYKQNLNQLLTALVIILKHVKSDLTAIYIKQYKHHLINSINIIKNKIKYLLSELLAYYNEELPFYKKKWWGGKTKKNKKWSNRYKKSINCKKPKGFSQKQYCKYGRNKTKRVR